MLLSRSHTSIKDADRAVIADAMAAYYARQQGVEPAGERLALVVHREPRVFLGCKQRRDALAPQIRALAAQDRSVTAIGKELGLDKRRIRRIAEENGIALRQPAEPKKIAQDLLDGRVKLSRVAQAKRNKAAPVVAEHAAQGLDLKAIAQIMGKTPKWIARIVAEHKITLTQGTAA